MQFADILYHRIPYTVNYEFIFRVIDDDPQPAMANPPYVIDFDDRHITDRGGYMVFNYARTDESEWSDTTMTFDEALEIFKKRIREMYADEIVTLNRKMDFIDYLSNNVENIECKTELSN